MQSLTKSTKKEEEEKTWRAVVVAAATEEEEDMVLERKVDGTVSSGNDGDVQRKWCSR